jgi:4'-phosphopantetheinyl transferase
MAERERFDALTLLSIDERNRCGRFFFEEDRRDFAAAHALLRRVLASNGSLPADRWPLEAIGGGKPRVASTAGADAELSFNLAHTRGLVACAVGRGVDLGIDVEAVVYDRDLALVADSQFAPIEREWIAAAPKAERPVRFVEIWTLKEAWLKATGDGLSSRLDAFAFSFEDSPSLIFHPPPGVLATDWRFALLEPGPGFRLAIAVRWNGVTLVDMAVRDDANLHQPVLHCVQGVAIEPAAPNPPTSLLRGEE